MLIVKQLIRQIYQCILLVVDFNIVERKLFSNLLKKQKNNIFFFNGFRLKYFGDNKYEIEGFTTVDKAKSHDTEYLRTPNSGNIKDYLFCETRSKKSVEI